MVSPHQLRSTIEAALLELMHAIHSSLSALQTLLSYLILSLLVFFFVFLLLTVRSPKAPDSSPISLRDMDVQIAVVLDQGLDAELVADIQKHLEYLFGSGLWQQLIMLIKLIK